MVFITSSNKAQIKKARLIGHKTIIKLKLNNTWINEMRPDWKFSYFIGWFYPISEVRYCGGGAVIIKQPCESF